MNNQNLENIENSLYTAMKQLQNAIQFYEDERQLDSNKAYLADVLANKDFAEKVGLKNIAGMGWQDIVVHKDDEIRDGNVFCHECGMPRLATQRLGNILFVEPLVHYHEFMDSRIDGLRKSCFAREWQRVGEKSRLELAREDTPDAHIRLVRDFCDNYHVGDGLLLYGECDRGKTFLAACICNKLIDKGIKCRIATLRELIAQMLENGENKTISALVQNKLVVIDDFGTERLTDFNLEKCYAIIDALYKAETSMIVTTNLCEQEILQPQPEYIRVLNRIKEHCKRFEVKGESMRKPLHL